MAQEGSPMVVDIRGFGTTAATAREPADRASIRRSNLGMILCRRRDHGPRSLTGLSGAGLYIRMYGTAYGYSLWSMQVYGPCATRASHLPGDSLLSGSHLG